jgi:hypothetical protein
MAVKKSGKSSKNGNTEKTSSRTTSPSVARKSKDGTSKGTDAPAVKRIEIPLPINAVIENDDALSSTEPCEMEPAKKSKSKDKPNPVRQGFVIDMRRKLLREIFERCLLKHMKQDMDPWES